MACSLHDAPWSWEGSLVNVEVYSFPLTVITVLSTVHSQDCNTLQYSLMNYGFVLLYVIFFNQYTYSALCKLKRKQ